MNWYRVYNLSELPTVNWLQFQQAIRWNVTGTEFCLEYIAEPTDKSGVMTRDEAAALMKTEAWEPFIPFGHGEG